MHLNIFRDHMTTCNYGKITYKGPRGAGGSGQSLRWGGPMMLIPLLLRENARALTSLVQGSLDEDNGCSTEKIQFHISPPPSFSHLYVLSSLLCVHFLSLRGGQRCLTILFQASDIFQALPYQQRSFHLRVWLVMSLWRDSLWKAASQAKANSNKQTLRR